MEIDYKNYLPKRSQQPQLKTGNIASSQGGGVRNSTLLDKQIPLMIPVKRNLPVRVRFFPDNSKLLMVDVGAAILPVSSADPFLNSFFAFYHDIAPVSAKDKGSVPLITYERPDIVGEDNDDNDDGPEEVIGGDNVVDVDDDEADQLLEHIRQSGLPLRLRDPTRSDGNCWYDAVADQVKHSSAYCLHLFHTLGRTVLHS